MTPKEQLKLWVKGKSVHSKTKNEDECCPDFSCCHPYLLAPLHERQAFSEACLSGDRKTAKVLMRKFLMKKIATN